MKKKHIVIGLASILILVGLILIIIFVFGNNKEKLEKNFSDIATEYFEKEVKDEAEGTINYLGYYMVTLSDLKNFEYDVSKFEKQSCDLTDTYAKFTLNENDYNVDVHMACQE